MCTWTCLGRGLSGFEPNRNKYSTFIRAKNVYKNINIFNASLRSKALKFVSRYAIACSKCLHNVSIRYSAAQISYNCTLKVTRDILVPFEMSSDSQMNK